MASSNFGASLTTSTASSSACARPICRSHLPFGCRWGADRDFASRKDSLAEQTMLVTPTNPASTERSKPPILTIVIAAVVLVAIAISIWMVLNNPAKPIGLIELNAPAKMNAQEQAYAKTMRIENIALSRAENFIHQEVTILKADIVNDGPRSVQKLFVTVEFFDDMRQIVLRETRPALG